MGKNTGIGWCATRQPDGTLKPGHTWNPWYGCTKVSAGCKNCYMFREIERYGISNPSVVTRSKTTFNDPLKWKEPARVFTCSWSDFFHPDADEWRDEAWDIIRDTPHLNYLILTKRPELIQSRLPADWHHDIFGHVWLGVSIENQAVLDERMEIMIQIPLTRLFVSAEPLLEYVDFRAWYKYIDWMIVGGESGEGARDMPMGAAARIIDECRYREIPVFFKQWGARKRNLDKSWGGNLYMGEKVEEWPEDTRKVLT